MAEKMWEIVKVRYCQHAGTEVEFEAQVVYPAEWLPEQKPPRVSSPLFPGHRLQPGRSGELRMVWHKPNL